MVIKASSTVSYITEVLFILFFCIQSVVKTQVTLDVNEYRDSEISRYSCYICVEIIKCIENIREGDKSQNWKCSPGDMCEIYFYFSTK